MLKRLKSGFMFVLFEVACFFYWCIIKKHCYFYLFAPRYSGKPLIRRTKRNIQVLRFENYMFLLICAISKQWMRNLPLNWVRFFNRFLPIAFTPTSSVCSRLNVNFFRRKFSKLAVECDWSNRNSQNVPNFCFLGKFRVLFWKNTLKFAKISEFGKKFSRRRPNEFFFKNVLPHCVWGFLVEIHYIFKGGKIRTLHEERNYFERNALIKSWRAQNIPDVTRCLFPNNPTLFNFL